MSVLAALQPRADVRYEIFGEQSVALSLDTNDHRFQPQVVVARLLNLSVRGARLEAPCALAPGQTFRLKLSNDRLGLNFYLAGQVCWSAMKDERACIVGCRLNPRIPDALLHHLAAGGRLDRRESTRRAETCSLRIVGGADLHGDLVPAGLANYAAGGMCLELTQRVQLGDRLEVVFDEPLSLALQVVARWQLEQGDRLVLGCEYVDRGDCARIEAALAKIESLLGG